MLLTDYDYAASNFRNEWIHKRTEVYAFGLSSVLKNLFFVSNDKEKIHIKGIFDNNCAIQGTVFNNCPILEPSEIVSMNPLPNVLIFAGDYQSIREQLLSYGMRENINFFKYSEYVMLKSWYTNSKLRIPQIHITVTTRCTLRCEDCNMFMTKYPMHSEISLNELKDDVDSFFEFVDYVELFQVLGGEPLLYKELFPYLKYVIDKHKDRIGSIALITNGTILPDESLLDICRDHVWFNISNYSPFIEYGNKLSQLMSKLDEKNIRYSLSNKDNWIRFNSFDVPLPIYSQEEMVEHYNNCTPVFKGLNDGKIYNCHLIWSANRAGLFKESEKDFIELKSLDKDSKEDKEKLMKFYLNYNVEGFLSMCLHCRGCDKRFALPVKTAKQARLNV